MKDAIAKVREEAQETAIDIAKSYKDAFDSVEKEYKNKLGMISHEIDKLNNQIAATEYNGEEANYSALRIQEQQTLTTLNKEAAALQKKLDAAVASGKIAEGSDAWYEMKEAIAAVEEEAQQTAIALSKSYKDAFDSVEKSYKNVLSSISHEIAGINNQISASEYTGAKRDFDALRAQEERSLQQLGAEAEALEAKLRAAVYSGRIKEGSAAWYEMKDAIAATREEAQQTAIDIAKSYRDAFDDVENTYKNRLSTISHILTGINNQIAASEYNGEYKPFEALRSQEEKNFKLLNEEADALQMSLDEAVASGKIARGSDAWYDMRNAIVSVREEAQQTAIDIAKSYKDAFDSVEKMYENRLSMISHGITEINNRISASEYTGELGNYEALRAQQTERLKLLNGEASSLQKSLDEAVASGKIKEGSNAWYEMKDAIASVREEAQQTALDIAKSYKDAFDDIESRYSNALSMLENKTKALQNSLNMIEARGYMGGKNLYEQMSNITQASIDAQMEELGDLETALNEALKADEIAEGSSAWYEMQGAIDAVKLSIQESEIQLVEYQNKIRQLDWDAFDYLQERIESISDEAEFLIDLLEYSDLFEDNGAITGAGDATLGLHAVKYNVYAEQVQQYGDAIRELNEEIAKDPNNKTLIERREKLLKLQRDSVLATEKEKQAVVDLIEDGINIELKALKELIDKYNDSLSSAKDLYDYQKRVSKQAKTIATLQKQIAAYSGDTSEEARATAQKLRVELEDANEELLDMQYDRYINDQKRLLDNLYDEYEEILNARLDNVDALMREIIISTNENSDHIRAVIADECASVGITMTSEMEDIWTRSGAVVATITNGIPDQMNLINGTLTNVNTGVTTVNGVLANVATNVQGMITAGNNIKAQIGVSATSVGQTIGAQIDTSAKGIKTALAGLPGEIGKAVGKAIPVSTPTAAGETVVQTSGGTGSSGGNVDVDVTLVDPVVGPDTITVEIPDVEVEIEDILGGGWDLGDLDIELVGGFASGGMVGGSKKAVRKNGDDIVTVNTLKTGEAVLTAEQARQFRSFANHLPALQSMMDVNNQIKALSPISPVAGNIDVGGFNMTFQIDHVQDYNDFVRQLRDDKTFERMIKTITLDPLVGKSSLSKRKYYNN